ncbi:MAG: 4-(cytidine 5'-diphospho)-2-C-methyl-D-erythritol kinase, partial [Planctomycetia bacterium]|nr:4-(cytidine 5'-diphospho)-2-C-methyl-D-erythritol kinase [Planctomycetia bacterium]
FGPAAVQGMCRMWVHRGAQDIEVQAPAKLNLFFEVYGRRPDGYHEIETLMVPVSLYDALSFRDVAPPAAGQVAPLTLPCHVAAGESSGTQLLPQGADNLVIKAIDLLRRRAGIERGAVVRLWKRIPMAAGLGGGSSDAAAALVAANLAWGLGYSRDQLVQLAAEIGSDVPFFLYRGPAICRGRGERIEPLTGLGDLHAVIVRPPMGLSTAEVYARCRPQPPNCGASDGRSVQRLCAAMQAGRIGEAGRLLTNRLQPAAAELSPWIERLADEFTRLGCVGHQLTGSGSAYFGLCRHAAEARHVAGRLRGRGLGQVYAVRRG